MSVTIPPDVVLAVQSGRRPIVACLAILLAALSALNVEAGQSPGFTFRTVALTGQPAPGTPAGTTFANLEGARIDASGRVAFYGMLNGPNIDDDNNAGVWSERSGTLQLVAREGNQAPGLPAGTLLRVIRRNSGGFTDRVPALEADLGMDDDGNVSFKAMLIGGVAVDSDGNGFYENDEAWFSDADGALSLLIRTDEPVPGQPAGERFLDHTFSPFGAPIVARDGRIGGAILTTGPGVTSANDFILFQFDADGSFRIVAREGDDAPGIPGAQFVSFGTPRFGSTNGEETMYIVASISGAGVSTSNDLTLWRIVGNQFTLIAREGELVEGGQTLQNFRNFSVTAPESFAFVSDLSGNEQGMFRIGPSGLETVACAQTLGTGGAALHFSLFSSFNGFGGPLQANQLGQIAFFSMLDGDGVEDGTRMSLWRAKSDGALVLLARDGMTAPDSGGFVFGGFHSFDVFAGTFQAPAMNALGQVVFRATLLAPGAPGSFNADPGLFVADADDVVSKVIRKGDAFDVFGDGSDLRIVENIAFHGRSAVASESSSEQYNGPSLNDNGTLVFELTFADGSKGVFTASIPSDDPVPGDIDGDGDVDVTDANLFALALIGEPVAPVHIARSDLNGDGLADGRDLPDMVMLLVP